MSSSTSSPEKGTTSSSSSSSPSSSSVTVVANPVNQLSQLRGKTELLVDNTLESFRSKPYQSTAVALSFLSCALTVLATFTPWWQVNAGPQDTPGGTVTMEVAFYTTEMRYCQTTTGVTRNNETDPQFINSKECTLVYLYNIAPILNYFYATGSVAIAFLIIALFFSVPAAYLTYLRRMGSLWRIPEKVYYLRKKYVPSIFHGMSAICLLVAWAHYIAAVNTSYNEIYLRVVIFFQDLVDIIKFRDPYLSIGFAATVTAFLCSSISSVLTALFSNEISRTSPEGASALAAAASASAAHANTASVVASGNTRTALNIAGAYEAEDERKGPVSEWGAGGNNMSGTNSNGFTTVAISALPGGGYTASSSQQQQQQQQQSNNSQGLPPPLPAARAYNSSSSTSSSSEASAPPLPPKNNRSAAVLLAQGVGKQQQQSSSSSSSLPPPSSGYEDEDDNGVGGTI